MTGDQLGGHVFEVKLQAARQNRYRQALRIGGRQQEFNVRRWLFQGFQQRIKRMRREHVHLIDQVHLVAATGRCVLHVLQQLAGIFYLGAASGIHLDQIDKAVLGNLDTGGTLATGLGANARLAV